MYVRIFLATFFSFYMSTAISATVAELEKKLSDLEKQQAEMFLQMNEEKNRVKPFLQNEILLGGFFETGVTNLSGPRMKTQTSSASHIMGLNLSVKLTERDRFVGQVQTGLGYNFVNRHSDPRVTATPTRQFTTSTASTIMAHAYYEHSFSTALNTQFGLGYVPFGLAYQYREPLLHRRRGGEAQMVNHSGSQNGGTTSVGVAFPLWVGFHMHGSFPFMANRWGYNFYTFTPTTDSTTMGEGARLWFKPLETITVGFSGQLGEHKRQRYTSEGIDIDFKYKNFGITMESATSTVTGIPSDSPSSYYVTPYLELNNGKFVVFGFLDYLDNPTAVTQTTGFPADPYERLDSGGGVNWIPEPNIRFRLDFTKHEYRGSAKVIEPESRRFNSVDFSTVIAF